MSWRRFQWVSAFCLLMWAVVATSAPALKVVQKPVDAPVGEYVVVRQVINGRELNTGDTRIKIEKEFVTFYTGSTSIGRRAAFFRVGDVLCLDIYDKSGKAPYEQCIWKVEKGEIHICIAVGFRPTEFSANRDSKQVILVLRKSGE